MEINWITMYIHKHTYVCGTRCIANGRFINYPHDFSYLKNNQKKENVRFYSLRSKKVNSFIVNYLVFEFKVDAGCAMVKRIRGG